MDCQTFSRPLPSSATLDYLRQQEQPELLKYSINDPQSFDYWDVVFKLVMGGDIERAVEFLILHSEIAATFLLSNEGSVSHSGSYRSPFDRSQCVALFDLMMSHPYARLIASADTDSSLDASSFYNWQAKLKGFRQSQTDVLVHIPQLDRLLCILLGEMKDLADVADGDWMLLSHAMLLYVCPPPLTRLNLAQVIGEAVKYSQDSIMYVLFSVFCS